MSSRPSLGRDVAHGRQLGAGVPRRVEDRLALGVVAGARDVREREGPGREAVQLVLEAADEEDGPIGATRRRASGRGLLDVRVGALEHVRQQARPDAGRHRRQDVAVLDRRPSAATNSPYQVRM